MLPFLVVLFLLSYGLMTVLIVEQDRTITAQSSLIHQLFQDSLELVNLKTHAQTHAAASTQAGAKSHVQSKTPSSQVTPQEEETSKGKPGKLQKRAPMRPPRDTSDTADERRNLLTI